MEMTLNNGFCEMPFDEMVDLEGGKINGWGIASGMLSIVGGGFAIAAAVVDPEPVSKGYALTSGVCWVGSGITGIVAACQ